MTATPPTSDPVGGDPAARGAPDLPHPDLRLPDERARLGAAGRALIADGLVATADLESADVVVFNTCCIRENADNKFYGHLGNLKTLRERRPDMQIAVGGCLAQMDKDRDPRAGPARRRGLRHPQPDPGPRPPAPGGLLRPGRRDPRRAPAAGRRRRQQVAALAAVRDLPYTAWVTIQTGCDNSCAFCIVPRCAGGEVSRRPGRPGRRGRRRWPDAGVTEVTLLGQNVNSYGRDLDPPPPALRRAAAGGGRGRGHPAGPVHQPPSERPPARDHRRHGRDRRGVQPPPPSAAVGQ